MEPFIGAFILLWIISRSNFGITDSSISDKWEALGWSEFQLSWVMENGDQRNMMMDKLVRTTRTQEEGESESVSTEIMAYRLWVTGDNINRRYPNPTGQYGTLFHSWNPSWKFDSFAAASAAGQAWIDASDQPAGEPSLPPTAPEPEEPLPPPPVAPPSGEPLPPPSTTPPAASPSPLLTNSGVNALNGQDLPYIGEW